MARRNNSHSKRVKAGNSRRRKLTDTLRARRLEEVCARMARHTDAPLDKYCSPQPLPRLLHSLLLGPLRFL